MELTRKDKTFLLKNFPKMELCYEKKVYNTVQNADIYLTIPKGLKYFIWFRSFKKKNCCMLLQLGKNKKTPYEFNGLDYSLQLEIITKNKELIM